MVYVTTTDPNHVVKYNFYKIYLNTVTYKMRLNDKFVMISSITGIKRVIFHFSFRISFQLPM